LFGNQFFRYGVTYMSGDLEGERVGEMLPGELTPLQLGPSSNIASGLYVQQNCKFSKNHLIQSILLFSGYRSVPAVRTTLYPRVEMKKRFHPLSQAISRTERIREKRSIGYDVFILQVSCNSQSHCGNFGDFLRRLKMALASTFLYEPEK
jgi:hypothetical protein